MSDVFGVTHIRDGLFLTASFEDVVPLLMAANRYVTNPNQPRGVIPGRSLYSVAMQYVRFLHVLYSSIPEYNLYKVKSDGFGDFLTVKIPHTKIIMIDVLNNFTNAMKLFQDKVAETKRSVELKNLNRQKRVTGGIRNIFFSKDPVSAPSSASPIAFSEPPAELVYSSTCKNLSKRPKRDKESKWRNFRRPTLGSDTCSEEKESSSALSDPQPARKKHSVLILAGFRKEKHPEEKKPDLLFDDCDLKTLPVDWVNPAVPSTAYEL